MGLVLDKCCCSNDGRAKDFEDFNTPELRSQFAPLPISQSQSTNKSKTHN